MKSYRVAFNFSFAMGGIYITALKISMLMRCWEVESTLINSATRVECLLHLHYLSRPPYVSFRLASNWHLTPKTCFLLALVAANPSELLGLSCNVHHWWGWGSCTFSFGLHCEGTEPFHDGGAVRELFSAFSQQFCWSRWGWIATLPGESSSSLPL